MKTSNNFLKGTWLFLKVLFLTLLFIIVCTKQNNASVILNKNFNEMNLKSLISIDDEVCLKGTSNFDVFSPKENRVVVNPSEMYLIMEAKLKHVDGQNYLLTTTEYMPLPEGPALYRKFVFEVKILADGVLQFSYPKTWWEQGENKDDILGQFRDHTGCIASGPGVYKGTLDWKGSFDGENFHAATNFTAKQVQEPVMPVYAGLDGPIKFKFSMTLAKIDCTESK